MRCFIVEGVFSKVDQNQFFCTSRIVFVDVLHALGAVDRLGQPGPSRRPGLPEVVVVLVLEVGPLPGLVVAIIRLVGASPTSPCSSSTSFVAIRGVVVRRGVVAKPRIRPLIPQTPPKTPKRHFFIFSI